MGLNLNICYSFVVCIDKLTRSFWWSIKLNEKIKIINCECHSLFVSHKLKQSILVHMRLFSKLLYTINSASSTKICTKMKYDDILKIEICMYLEYRGISRWSAGSTLLLYQCVFAILFIFLFMTRKLSHMHQFTYSYQTCRRTYTHTSIDIAIDCCQW